VFALAGPAAAGTPGESCLAIADPTERLACFDREIGAAARGPADQAQSPRPLPVSQAAPVAASTAAPALSLLDAAWGFAPDSRKAYVRLHQPNYLLFARYTDDVNNAPYQPLFDAFAEEGEFDDVEAKFQLSFKGRLLTTDDRRWGLWFAYTQQSQWQLYSEDISRPFRELPAGRRAGQLPLERAQFRLHAPVQWTRGPDLAQLGPAVRRGGHRA
jgi:phospholipase A1